MQTQDRINRFYRGCHLLINLYMRSLGRLDLHGTENIPSSGGLIIASNHVAQADPFLLGSTVNRELWFMAKKELFKSLLMRSILSRLNTLPVDRFGFDMEVIKKSLAVLRQGGALVMFPEGTRSKNGKIHEGKIGVGMLAKKAAVPIVPACIENSKKAWLNFFQGKRLSVIFGKVVEVEWINAMQNSKNGYEEIADEVMKRIKTLKQEIDLQQRMAG